MVYYLMTPAARRTDHMHPMSRSTDAVATAATAATTATALLQSQQITYPTKGKY